MICDDSTVFSEAQPASAMNPIRIEPPCWRGLSRLKTVFAYRHMIYFSLYRDFKTQYIQTILGPIWAVLRQLIQLVLFSILFGVFAQMPTDGVPYPVFLYTGLVPWSFYQIGLNCGIGSIHSNFTIITKIYFPRAILPFQATLFGFFDFGFSFFVLLVVSCFFGVYPNVKMLAIPFLLFPGYLLVLGLALALCAMSVQFRDVRLVSPYITQMIMYFTPILWPLSSLPERWRALAATNPIYVGVTGTRWAFGIAELPSPDLILYSLLIGFVTFLIGWLIFERLDHNLIDMI